MAQILRFWLVIIVVLTEWDFNYAAAREPREPRTRQTADFLLEVHPRIIAVGETAELRWSIKGATRVAIEESTRLNPKLRQIGTFRATGALKVRPAEDTTYVVSCEGSTTYSCASVSLRVRVKRR